MVVLKSLSAMMGVGCAMLARLFPFWHDWPSKLSSAEMYSEAYYTRINRLELSRTIFQMFLMRGVARAGNS